MQNFDSIKKMARDEDERILLARFCERIQRALSRNIPQFTDFLTPAERALLLAAADHLHLQNIRFAGGYPDAERTIAIIMPTDCPYEPLPPIAVLAIETKGAPLSHRDLLGALMALGIKREKLGDIIPAADPPLLFCDSIIAPYLIEQFERAGHNRVALRPADATAIPQSHYSESSFTVQSLRLDAVVAEGFSISRTQTADLIRQGCVYRNWRLCESPAAEVSEGDRLTLRGRGRITVVSVGGQSRKGRIFVTVRRFE